VTTLREKDEKKEDKYGGNILINNGEKKIKKI
jgi:hypothetical protein